MIIYTEILIRYGDISIKGRNKSHFIQALKKRLLEVFPPTSGVGIHTNDIRTFLSLSNDCDPWSVLHQLQTVFGITSASLAIKVSSDLAAINEAALQIAQAECRKGDTLKVSSKRAHKSFPISSMELSKKVAGYVLNHMEQAPTVDLTHPTKHIRVEVREAYAYVMLDKIVLHGGFPQGCLGRGALMLSGGIDSPVAGFLALRKGIELIAVHFASPPYTSPRALDKVVQLITKLEAYQVNIPLYVVPFTEIQRAIAKHVMSRYQMVVMRRMMYQITEHIAKREQCRMLINGESLGQVASQTMESMQVVHPVVELPILQPVSTYDKNEIIALAKQIQTYEISTLPYEDCCTIFVPKDPVTRPKKSVAEYEEKKIDTAFLIESALNGTKLQKKSDFLHNICDFF